MGASVGTCQGEGWPNCGEALRCERCGDCKEGWRQQPGFVRTQSVVDQVYSHADAQDEEEVAGTREAGWAKRERVRRGSVTTTTPKSKERLMRPKV
mmetsp:Transcript_30598/g.97481  ORF Transcript_30598/g.97481 Transcript_30598/m.97481 type:complete len:96 (+) Transcript_30598:392-679(+)